MGEIFGSEQNGHEAALLLAEVVHRLHRRLQRRLAPLLGQGGIHSLADLAVCLWVARRGPQRPADVVRALGLPASSTTEAVDRLVAAGYLERRPNPSDRRSVVVAATERGLAVRQQLQAAMQREVLALLEGLPEETLAGLASGLRAVVQRLEGE